MVAKCRPMAGPREFGSIGQNRLRTGSVGRFGKRATTATSRGRAKCLGNSGESGEPLFRELEPAGRVAPAGCEPTGCGVSGGDGRACLP